MLWPILLSVSFIDLFASPSMLFHSIHLSIVFVQPSGWMSLLIIFIRRMAFFLFSVFIVFYLCRTFYFTLCRCSNPLHIGSFWQWSSSASHSQRAKYAPISSVYLAFHRAIANYSCNGRTRPPKGVFVGRFDSVYIHPNNSRCLHITVGRRVVKQLPLFDRPCVRPSVCIRQPEDE